MVASGQVEIPFFKGIGRQRRPRFGALAQVIGRIANPFMLKHIVPAAKRMTADLLEIAEPEIANLVSRRKHFKTAANSVRRKKQLSSGNK